MTLKDDLIRVGYLPEGLPPSFRTGEVADWFLENPSSYISDPKGQPVRSAVYNSSKRGISRRSFSVVHPITAHDLAEFLQNRAPELDKLFEDNKASFSVPKHTPDASRALEIASPNRVEMGRLTRLSGYRFVAKTDTSRFYHSIYTHSVPWAFMARRWLRKIASPIRLMSISIGWILL